ncbi:hypothetical protein [Rhizobium sp. BK602]|uniref:phage major tropism determinant n=1 Tax=Rhizobium sp. BK602 TaxID=2586986 RepID=UPI0016107262|nr:hypothetical protein [Rhizobium sp. BK602]MBB3608628.1 hypothetical protein [Rhizobium sp. BK602]
MTSIRIHRSDLTTPILATSAATTVAIRAGTVIEIDGQPHAFGQETPIALDHIAVGTDYGVSIDANGKPVAQALSGNPRDSGFVAGFHAAPGGCALERNGSDAIPAINPYSLWDMDFRPACPDPRGMTLVEAKDGHRFWVDIYLLGVDYKEHGTSRHGIEIADGRSLDRLDFKTAAGIYASHGKRLLTYDEFRTAAFGVTERSSADRDPKTTGLDAARTSKFGLMQATGNLWVWGTDGDIDDPRPSLFGGSWLGGSVAGSRYADLGYWPGSSHGNLSARGGSDHMAPA